MPLFHWLRRLVSYRQRARHGQSLRYSLIATLGFSVGIFADATEQDLANERFYTPPAAMEQHWQVDCSTLEHRIGAAFGAADAASTSRTPELQSLLGELHKCAMIYNPPGTTAQHSCPGYAASHAYLQQWLDPEPAAPHSATATATPTPAATLQLILQPLHCPLPPP